MKRVFLGIFGGLALFIFVVALTGALLFWLFTRDDVSSSSQPMTREAALGKCPIPLPAAARRVQYFTISSGMQGGEMFARFEAPVADCEAEAQNLFAATAKDQHGYTFPEFRQTLRPGSVAVDRSQSSDPVPPIPTWFDTDRGGHWEVAGKGQGWQPKVWIDKDQGIFYYYATD